ncbi:hypothetical protein G9A89_011114 [Geosiphon pyriformis]|nr:hypothetical protein G9A89_011114 [Geosiphon pyriformis]
MTPVLLFSRATLDTKSITAMYTDVKVDGHSIKLILNSGSTGSIITKQLMDQLENNISIQNVKENRTMDYVLLAVNSCSTKRCGIIFLGKEKHMTLYANTRFSSTTG